MESKPEVYFAPLPGDELPRYIEVDVGIVKTKFKLLLFYAHDSGDQLLDSRGFVQVPGIAFLLASDFKKHVDQERKSSRKWGEVFSQGFKPPQNSPLSIETSFHDVWDKDGTRRNVGISDLFRAKYGDTYPRSSSKCNFWQELVKCCITYTERTSGKKWSVKARFHNPEWDDLTTPVTLYISWSKEIYDSIGQSAIEDCLKTVSKKLKIEWSPVGLESLPNLHLLDSEAPGELVIPNTHGNRRIVLLGSNFLDLYRMYILPADRDRLGLSRPNYPTPGLQQIQTAIDRLQPTGAQEWNQFNTAFDKWLVAGKKFSAEQADLVWQNYVPDTNKGNQTTLSLLDTQAFDDVVGQERCKGQSSVMNGHSATEVANIFRWNSCNPWPYGSNHRSEWLHRSAFSFGGLGFKRSNWDSSQNARNLIFGSVEANTLMLRFEDTIKRVVRRIDPKKSREAEDQAPKGQIWDFPGVLMTTTYPLSAELDDGSTWNPAQWLTGQLEYKARLDIPNIETKEFGAIIDPFSRPVPTLLESYLDEVVENKWLDHKLGPSEIEVESDDEVEE